MVRRRKSSSKPGSAEDQALVERKEKLREMLRRWSDEPTEPSERDAWLELRRALDEGRPPERGSQSDE